MGLLLPIIILQVLVLTCKARPDGAPLSSCSSLIPVHGYIQPQRSSSPYTVHAEKSGDKILVTISSPSGEEFDGFMLQARSSRNKQKKIEGRFTHRNGVSKAIDCFKGHQNTLTHVNTQRKSKILTEWTPSGEVNEDIIFRATVAKTFDLFWTEIDSTSIRVKNEGSTANRDEQVDRNSDSMYDNCLVSKGCFGYPAGCVPNRDCEVLLSYSPTADGIAFKMSGYLEPQTYMAMGLSNDASMGDDAVTECFLRDSSTYVVARESWNDGQSNARTRDLKGYNGEYKNGLSSCSWTSRYLMESNGRRFNLENSTYHVLIAKGPLSNGRLTYHSGRLATQQPVNFTAFEAIAVEGVSDSIKIHGTFMVTAWVGFVSLAILLARHFKSAWESSTICGVKVWFALHRALMFIALVFVVVAFIVIFVYKKGWNYETKNPHAILGCIATALGLFQPIMAAFRPAPDHPKRPVFNWLHWGVGNSAQIIAVIAIFFAADLKSSGLDKSFYWVMGIFVIVYLIFHFLFQVLTWTSGKKKNNEVKMLDMSSGRTTNNIQNNTQEKSTSENVFRVMLLGIYAIFLVVIILALYTIIGVA